MGGVGKKTKKNHARVNAKKKNSCKEEDKEKNFMQKESPVVTFIQNWLVSTKVVLIQKILGVLPQAHYY